MKSGRSCNVDEDGTTDAVVLCVELLIPYLFLVLAGIHSVLSRSIATCHFQQIAL